MIYITQQYVPFSAWKWCFTILSPMISPNSSVFTKVLVFGLNRTRTRPGLYLKNVWASNILARSEGRDKSDANAQYIFDPISIQHCCSVLKVTVTLRALPSQPPTYRQLSRVRYSTVFVEGARERQRASRGRPLRHCQPFYFQNKKSSISINMTLKGGILFFLTDSVFHLFNKLVCNLTLHRCTWRCTTAHTAGV